MVAQERAGHKNPMRKWRKLFRDRWRAYGQAAKVTRFGTIWRNIAAAALASVVIAGAGLATPAQNDPADGERGPVTNLPLPRYVSLKTDEGNARRGPSLTHRIDWVFTRENMPVQVIAEYGHWRRVRDRDGAGGWVHYAMLSGVRTVLVEQDMLPVRVRPDPQAPITANFESGVIARLGACNKDWCRITAGGYRGWAEKSGFWGVDPDELRD